LLALDVDPALVVQFWEGDEALAAYQRVRGRLEARARAAGLERAYVVDRALRIRVDTEPAQLPGRPRSALLANRSEIERAASGQASPTRLYRDEQGRLRLSAFAPLAGHPVTALLGVDASPSFFEPLAALRRQMFLLGALGVASAGLAGFLLVGQVGRRLERLRRVVGRVARGDLSARSEASGADEIGALGRDLDGMIVSIVATRDYYEAVMDGLDVGLVTSDGGGQIRLANASARRLLASEEHLVGRPLESVLAHEAALRAFVSTARGRPAASAEIELGGGVAGGGRVVAASVSPLQPPGGPPGLALSLLDVSELRLLERRARHNERLAALGGMAGGLLHEIRNPLAAITVYLDLLRQKDTGAEVREIVERILAESERLNGFLEDFQVFAGLKPLRREVVTAAAVAEEAAGSLRWPAAVQLRRELPPELRLDIDRRLVVHALRNLLQNALDALAGRSGEIGLTGCREAHAVVLSVADDGPGIAPERRERVLEPMFTTRAGGIGLGLTIVERVVQAHDGKLHVAAAPSGGALFRLWLPAAVD
jgi:signal transduction histidine kinase/HAMP domain-containing protein